MPLRWPLPVLGVIGLLVAGAGCTTPPPVDESGPRNASPTTLDADLGSVAGTVADDESRPIEGVSVAIIEADLRARTDATGAFNINGIPPGSYRFYFERLGYEAAARKVEVKAGELTQVHVQLKPVIVTNESYTYTVPRTTLIHFGPAFLYSWFVAAANQSTVNGLFCEPCWHILHFTKGPKGILSEPTWPGANVCPNVNCEAWVFYKSSWTTAHSLTDGQIAFSGNFHDRDRMEWPETTVKSIKALDRMMLVESNGVTYPIVEMRITTYTSFSYNGDFPENFTALPPK